MYPIKVTYHHRTRATAQPKMPNDEMTDRNRGSSTSSPIPSCGSLCAQDSFRT
jgi:hypothetical protein